jgi:hypothetical protein
VRGERRPQFCFTSLAVVVQVLKVDCSLFLVLMDYLCDLANLDLARLVLMPLLSPPFYFNHFCKAWSSD